MFKRYVSFNLARLIVWKAKEDNAVPLYLRFVEKNDADKIVLSVVFAIFSW